MYFGGAAMTLYNEELNQLSIDMVKRACRKYWLEKDATLFTEYLYSTEVPVIGLDSADTGGIYEIEQESYHVYPQSEQACLVVAELTICNTERMFAYKELVDVMVLCTGTDNGIRFSAIHMSVKKKNI